MHNVSNCILRERFQFSYCRFNFWQNNIPLVFKANKNTTTATIGQGNDLLCQLCLVVLLSKAVQPVFHLYIQALLEIIEQGLDSGIGHFEDGEGRNMPKLWHTSSEKSQILQISLRQSRNAAPTRG